MPEADWTPGEMLAVAASHFVGDEDVVLVGLGLPQIAAFLAKQTRAPNATLLFEIGVFEPNPVGEGMGIADPRLWQGASGFGSMLDVLGYMLGGGRVSLGLLGALQVDAGGSINSSLALQPDGTARRFRGSGGANDIASLARRVVVVMKHEPRKFKEVADFVTSPGRRIRGRGRAELGLEGEGTVAVVSDRAVIEITASGAVLASVHPGQLPEAVVAETPMPMTLPAEGPASTPAPSPIELRLIREQLDPHGWYTR